MISASGKTTKEKTHVLPGESWSWTRFAEQEILDTLRSDEILYKQVVTMIAGILDEGKFHGLEASYALTAHCLKVLEGGAADDMLRIDNVYFTAGDSE